MNTRLFKTLASIAAATVLAACGGGGGDAGGGIGGTGGGGGDGAGGNGVSVGTITDFGSVWVNGVEFSSDGAVVKRDDNPVAQSATNPLNRQGGLRQGMVARVEGSISNKTASTISVNSAAKGRVESTTGTTQMVVIGQTIIIDSGTVFENSPRPAVGDYVEVHGLVVSDGTIAAGFIEKKSTLAAPPFAVKGLVKNHTAGGNTFKIGELDVTLGAGAVTNDMPTGPWNGLQVEVKGSACSGNPPTTNVCGTLTATKVEPEGPRGNVAEVELEAFVTALTPPDGFNLGTQKVVTTGAVFVGGLASEVVVGTKLEVEGSMSGGVLTARKVSFRENLRFEANIAAKTTNSLTLAGLPGITIETNSLTQFKNRNFGQLLVGNNLRIRGRPGSGNSVIATEVEHRSDAPDSRVILQAVASAVAAPNVTLLGITVDTSPILDNNFKDVNDAPIGRSAFFAAAAPGKLIKARGTLFGSTVTWNQEIQLED